MTKTETSGKEPVESPEIMGEDITDKTLLQLTVMSEKLMSEDRAEKDTKVQEKAQESDKPQHWHYIIIMVDI